MGLPTINSVVLLIAIFLLVAEFVSNVEQEDRQKTENYKKKKEEIALEAFAYSFLKAQTKNLRHAVEEFENAIEEIEPRK